jgi:hypothetical protein
MGRHPSYGISKAYPDTYKSKSNTSINKLGIALCAISFGLAMVAVAAVYFTG